MSKEKDFEIQKLISQFEELQKYLFDKDSQRSISDIFSFVQMIFECHQVFYWKNEVTKNKFVPIKNKKHKYLSLVKSSPMDFFKRVDFLKSKEYRQGFIETKDGLFFSSHIDSDGFADVFFLDTPNKLLFKNELLLTLFETRFLGVLYALERLNQIQELNFIDDVTGLYNQRYLSVLLDQEIERYNRGGSPFSVLFVDVDHFKSVNDNNGHLVGSQILKEIGHIIKNTVRTVDSCFRYGGDEFLTVLSGASSEQAMKVADRICQSVAQTPFLVDGKSIRVTLSIGVACFPEHAQTKEKIIEVADQAMYSGKKASRNVVYVAS